jgi:hypothetical protein
MIANASIFMVSLAVLVRANPGQQLGLFVLIPILFAIPFYDSLPPLLRDRAAKITQPLVALFFTYVYFGVVFEAFDLQEMVFLEKIATSRLCTSASLNLAVFGLKNSVNAHVYNSSTMVVLKAKLKLARVMKGITEITEGARLNESMLTSGTISKPIKRGFFKQGIVKNSRIVYATHVG